MIDPEKFAFQLEVDRTLKGLDFQRERIFEGRQILHQKIKQDIKIDFEKLISTAQHDADFYMVLLRRLYRLIEEGAKSDSRVANLKGKHIEIREKIKIRDHFEHGVDIEKIPFTENGIKSVASVHFIGEKRFIVSGDVKWDLDNDHSAFKEIMEEFFTLYPFTKPSQ